MIVSSSLAKVGHRQAPPSKPPPLTAVGVFALAWPPARDLPQGKFQRRHVLQMACQVKPDGRRVLNRPAIRRSLIGRRNPCVQRSLTSPNPGADSVIDGSITCCSRSFHWSIKYGSIGQTRPQIWLRKRKKATRPLSDRVPLPLAHRGNEVWSMESVNLSIGLPAQSLVRFMEAGYLRCHPASRTGSGWLCSPRAAK